MQELDSELRSHFLNLYSLALCDTQVDTSELEMLFNFGQERGVSKEEIEKIILYPNQIRFTVPIDILKKIEYLYDFARMIWADKRIDEYEYLTLQKFCNRFGFEESNSAEIATFLIEEAKKDTPKIKVIEIVEENIKS